jgi:hypothetical protein
MEGGSAVNVTDYAQGDSQAGFQLQFFQFLGYSKYGLTALNIFDEGTGLKEKFYNSAPEECVRISRMFNGKGQVYASLNPVRQDIDKKEWHADDDVVAVLNIFIDKDAIKTHLLQIPIKS